MKQRIIIKIGSQVLCSEQGDLNVPVMSKIAGEIASLVKDGWQPLIVSSGAVAAGDGLISAAGFSDRFAGINDPVVRRQVLAATGQLELMIQWRECFADHSISVAQVLASKSDFQTRRHYLNMRSCIEALVETGVVPVINENDVVSVTELMFTDNDELAGLLAGMVSASTLCLLSGVDGVYSGASDDSQLIGTWDDSIHSTDDIVQRASSSLGRGGMHSKLNAARQAANLGTEVVIADGHADGILSRITSGEPCGTRFPANRQASSAKRWVASAAGHASASVQINAGAVTALRDQSQLTSLLPIGIESINGEFTRGDVILVHDPDGILVACGRAQYDNEQASEVLGQSGYKPLIHYDYLYLVD